MNNSIWVTWEWQRRNHTLSKALHSELHQLLFNHHWLLRYPVLTFRTLSLYLKKKPKVIFIQNPSMVLSLLTVLYCRFAGIAVITDAHNAGVFPFDGKKSWANYLSKFIMKKSDYYIVTNQGLADYVQDCGGKPFVLPDPIPDFKEAEIAFKKLQGERNVFFICSFATDEPYQEVIRSAKYLPENICIYISGNMEKMDAASRNELPKNVFLTGYLPENEYLGMLKNSDVAIDLTTRENCLVCGAYESIAIGTPLILSDTKAIREYFYKGVVYTDNTSQDIAEKIMYAISNIDKLKKEILDFSFDIKQIMEKRLLDFNTMTQKDKIYF